MIKYLVFCSVLALTISASGQRRDDTVATATGHTWTIRDLSPEAQDAAAKLPALIGGARKQLLSQYVGELLLEAETQIAATNGDGHRAWVIRDALSKIDARTADGRRFRPST